MRQKKPTGDLELPLHEFVSPLPLLALAVLALNDHLFKVRYGGWWTGKLSDFAGLIYFPLLLTAGVNTARTLFCGLVQWARGAGPPWPVYHLQRHHLVLAISFTGALFAAINVHPRAMGLYLEVLWWFHGMGIIDRPGGVCDLEDLIALPSLGVSYWWGSRYVLMRR